MKSECSTIKSNVESINSNIFSLQSELSEFKKLLLPLFQEKQNIQNFHKKEQKEVVSNFNKNEDNKLNNKSNIPIKSKEKEDHNLFDIYNQNKNIDYHK